MAVPQLFFTDEQAAELSDLSKTINDYVDEMMARFVIGDADLNKDWDTYLQTLEGMNLPASWRFTRPPTTAKNKLQAVPHHIRSYPGCYPG